MEPGRSNSCSDICEISEDKRQRIPIAKALVNKIENLQKERQFKVSKIKCTVKAK